MIMKHFFCVFFVFSVLFISCNKSQVSREDSDQITIKDSLELYKKLYAEADYFSIDQNENDQNEFSPNQVENVMSKVVQDYAALNQKARGNPLLPLNFGRTS